jgi:hypothetical protein
MDHTVGSGDPLAGMRASSDLSKQELSKVYVSLLVLAGTCNSKMGTNLLSQKVESML